MTFSRILIIVALLAVSLQVAIAGEPVSVADSQVNKQVYSMLLGMDEGMTIVQDDDKTVFEHIYPNIDLIISGLSEGALTYEFVVYPGGYPSDIQLNEQIPVASLEAFQEDAKANVKLIETSFSEGLHVEAGTYEQAQVLTIQLVPVN